MTHSSEMRDLCSTKYSRETYKKINVFFSFFNSTNFTFSLMNTLIYINIDQSRAFIREKVKFLEMKIK